FSDATAQSARLGRQSEDQTRPDMEAELAFSLFLGQMIYDVPDDDFGSESGFRGHSFARTMYGGTYSANGVDATTGRSMYTGDNSSPYSGPGRLHYNVTIPA